MVCAHAAPLAFPDVLMFSSVPFPPCSHVQFEPDGVWSREGVLWQRSLRHWTPQGGVSRAVPPWQRTPTPCVLSPGRVVSVLMPSAGFCVCLCCLQTYVVQDPGTGRFFSRGCSFILSSSASVASSAPGYYLRIQSDFGRVPTHTTMIHRGTLGGVTLRRPGDGALVVVDTLCLACAMLCAQALPRSL